MYCKSYTIYSTLYSIRILLQVYECYYTNTIYPSIYHLSVYLSTDLYSDKLIPIYISIC